MDAVRTDHHIAVDNRAVVEDGPRAGRGLNHVDAAAAAVQALHRQRGGQDRQQVGAVKMIIRRTIGIFGSVPSSSRPQHPAIVPAPDLDADRPDGPVAQRIRKTVTMQ